MYQYMLVRGGRSAFASFSAIFALALAGGGLLIAPSMALAAHTTSVTVLPVAVKGSQTSTYAFDITNIGSDSVYRTEITAPDGFSINVGSIACPTAWNSIDSTAALAICTANNPFGAAVITSGNILNVTFSATAANPVSDTPYIWSVFTQDTNGGATNTNTQAGTLVDVTPPTTTDDVTSSDWTSDDVIVTLTSDDTGSGVTSILYSTDGSDPSLTYTAPFALSASGTYTLKYSATDAVGNVEDVVTGSTVQIDKDAPAISNATIAYPDSQTAAKKGDTITISVTADDGSGSGVASVTTDLSGLGGSDAYALAKVGDTNVYSAIYLIPSDESVTASDGNVSVPITVIDAVENAASGNTDAFVFDNEVPTGSVSVSVPGGQTAIKDDDSIDVSGSVNGTGSDASVVSATLRQFNGEAEIGIGTDVTGSVSLTDGTLNGDASVGTLNESATAIKLEIVIKDGANSQVVLTSGSIAVDNTSPSFTSAEITPPGSQTKVKNVDTIQVEVETDSNTANTVTIDASAFGASNSVALSPKGESTTAFTGSFVVTGATTGAHSIQVSVHRTNNGATASGPSSNQLEVDNTLPTFETITANPNPAKAGTVTITFTALETLTGNPTVMVNGNVATFSENTDLAYTYTYEVTESDAQGAATISVVGLDLAANSGETEDTSLVIDTVKPLVSTVDSDGASFSAGDHTITVTFNEDVKDSPVPQIAVAYSATTGTCSDVSATNMTKVDATQYSYVLAVSDGCDAATGTVSISTAQDSAGNEMVINSAHTFSIDTVAPELVSAQTGDADGNGRIDTITASFSEDLNGETVASSDFSVVGYTVTNATEDNGIVTLTITESGTPDTGATPLVSVVGSVEDSTGNATTSGSVTAQDKAKPVMVSARTTSLTTIDVTFSESVNGSSLGSGDFSVADNTITNRAKNGDNVVTLTLGSAIGTGETPAVTVNGDGTGSGGVGVKDNVTANNWTVQHSIASENVDDGIAPVVASVTLNPVSPVKAGVVGITVTFSEDMRQDVSPVVIYDPQGNASGATAKTVTGSYTSATTWAGSFTVPTDDAANYDGEAVISISAGQDLNNDNVMAEDTGNPFTIDTTAPTLTEVSAPEGVIRGNVSLAFTATGADSCFYKIDDGDSQEIVNCTSPASISVADHKHTITLTARDTAGNESTSVSIDVLIDLDQNLTVGSSGEDFTTIQDAVDAATSGDTISVAAGTYPESITVDKSVSIVGAGVSSTIVQPATNSNGFFVTASTTIQNLKIDLTTSGVDAQAIRLEGANNVTISGNTIETTGDKGIGIWIGNVGYANSNNLNITGNTIIINGVSTGIYAEGGSTAQTGWQIKNNTITTASSNTVELYDVSNSEVSGNTFTITSAVNASNVMWFAELSNLSSLVFINNIVSGSSGSEVAIGTDFRNDGPFAGSPAKSITTVTVSGNTFSDWGSRALRIGKFGLGTVTGVTVSGNKFLIDSQTTTLTNTDDSSVNAEANWWGQSTGPATGAVVGTVDYRPWYTNVELTGLDSASPTPVITSSAGTLTNVSPIPFSVTFGTGETVYDFTSADITVTNGSASEPVASDSSYTFNVTPTAAGDVTVEVTANTVWDASGNYNTESNTASVTYDNSAPTLSSVSISSSGNEGWAKVGDTVTVTFVSDEDIQTPVVTIAEQTATVEQDGDAQHWSATYTMAGIEAEVPVAFNIGFTDLAGNPGSPVTQGTEGITGSVTFDKTAPVISVDSPDADSKVNGTAVIEFATDDEGGTVTCSVNGGAPVTCVSGDTELADVTGFNGLGQVEFTLTVSHTDTAGNVGTDSVTLTKDTSAPSVNSHTPSINAVNVDTDTITIVFNEAVNVSGTQITVSPAIPFTIDGTGTDTITLTTDPLDSNTVYTVTVTTAVKDLAGNALAATYPWSFTTATLYNVLLNADNGGWNLISLPIVPTDTDISAVLGDAENSIDVVWAYDPTNVNADVDNGGWFVYRPDNIGLSSLETMTAGYGYWISVTENTAIEGSGSLLTAGPTAPPSVDLANGWNLIGYYQIPGEDSSNMDDAFSSIGLAGTDYTALFGFNNASGASTNNVDEILPGDAFWISVSPSGGKNYTPSNL